MEKNNKDDMSTSYTREIIVSTIPKEIFKALTTGFNKWWTTGCNFVSKSGDKITFKFGASYWVMLAINLIPEKLVELECIEAHHVHDGLPSSILNEWKGSKLIWNIHRQDDKTKIVFTHKGLVPSLECYDICKQGWDYFFVNSLKQYLDTGKGSPFV